MRQTGITDHDACFSCGNVASILEFDENLRQEYKVFSHAPSVSSYLFVDETGKEIPIPFTGREINPSQTSASRILLVGLAFISGIYIRRFIGTYCTIIVSKNSVPAYLEEEIAEIF
jgi:hypothetical protein